MSSYCLNVIWNLNYVVYFHKKALLTPHLHDFDNLRNFVAKFCRNNLRIFSANLLGLKKSYRQLIRFLDVCSIMGWVRLQLYLDTASPKLRCSGDNVCPSAPFRKGGGMQIFDHSVFVRRSYCNGKSDFITRLKTRNGKVFSKFSCVQAREIGNPSVLKRGIFFSWASLMRRKIVANWEGGQRSLSRLSIC